MTLKDARKFIKQCEQNPLRFERTELISQGPRQGWCVSVAPVGGSSYIVYSVDEMDVYPRSSYA